MQKKTSPQILCQKIADIIRQKITIGELPPGERLSEATLSEQLEISRNTLREVFRILTQEGLLTYKPNRGVFVSVPDMASIMDIYRVRRLIECDALRHAYPMHPAISRMQDNVNQAKIFQQQKIGIALEPVICISIPLSSSFLIALGYLNNINLF